jgi:hypothetical protein
MFGLWQKFFSFGLEKPTDPSLLQPEEEEYNIPATIESLGLPKELSSLSTKTDQPH